METLLGTKQLVCVKQCERFIGFVCCDRQRQQQIFMGVGNPKDVTTQIQGRSKNSSHHTTPLLTFIILGGWSHWLPDQEAKQKCGSVKAHCFIVLSELLICLILTPIMMEITVADVLGLLSLMSCWYGWLKTRHSHVLSNTNSVSSLDRGGVDLITSLSNVGVYSKNDCDIHHETLNRCQFCVRDDGMYISR